MNSTTLGWRRCYPARGAVTDKTLNDSALIEGLRAAGYRFERVIGAGAHGQVWAAARLQDGFPVAVKVLRRAGDASDGALRRFRREARVGVELKHPGIVEVYDVVHLAERCPALILERLYGDNLQRKLEQQRVLSLRELAWLLSPVISALGTAHYAGVIHRDIKPSNVFCLTSGNPPAKLLDFGVSKLTAPAGGLAASLEQLTKTGHLVGTPAYMSPEQAFGDQIDYRTDYFSLGALLYHCLSGVRPISGEQTGQILKQLAQEPIRPIHELCPGLPVDLVRLIDQLLAKRPDERPRDLIELYNALEKHAGTRH